MWSSCPWVITMPRRRRPGANTASKPGTARSTPGRMGHAEKRSAIHENRVRAVNEERGVHANFAAAAER